MKCERTAGAWTWGRLVTVMSVIAVMLGAVSGLPASAATSCTVTYGTHFTNMAELQTDLTNGGDGCTATADGDSLTVNFDGRFNGNRPGTQAVSSALTWTHAADLVLRDSASNGTILNGGGTTQIFTSSNPSADVTIQYLYFSNGKVTGLSPKGGAVNVAGNLAVSNSSFTSNKAEKTSYSGQSYMNPANGGALYVGGNLSIANSTFSGNRALADDLTTSISESNGGAIYCVCASALTISSSNFWTNSSLALIGNGGAIATSRTNTTPHTITDSQFGTSNSANKNTATADGGALSIGPAIITGSSFRKNEAGGKGGAIASQGDVTLTSAVFESNISTYEGGGALVVGVATVTSSTFTSNNAGTDGGGFVASWGATVTNSVFTSNRALGGNGGAIATLFGPASIATSTINSNSASNDGGGISTSNDLTVVNSTIRGNQAGNKGGGIQGDGASNLTLTLSTVASNLAHSGAANIGNATAAYTTSSINGSVISDPKKLSVNSQTEKNCDATATTAVDSVTSDATCFANAGTNLVSTVAAIDLLPLANNSTGTPQANPYPGTSKPNTGSVLIGRIASISSYTNVTTDQLGVTRSLPTTVGAVHIASAASPVNATPSTSTTTPTQQGSSSPETTVSPTTTIGNTTTSTPGGALPITGVQTLTLLTIGVIVFILGCLPLVRRRTNQST